MNKRCKYCDERFKAKVYWQKFCSKSCKMKSWWKSKLEKESKMKKIISLLTILFFIPSCAYALDLALKTGFTSYKEEKPSKYIGNNCYDSPEFAYGAFLRYTKSNWIVRADYDTNKTGNTFLTQPSQPYEKIDLTQTNFSISAGSYLWEYLYVLLGATYTQNECEIEQYTAHPFTYETHDSFAPSITVGFEMPIKRAFVFGEYRYIFNDMDVSINGNKEFTEPTDNGTFFMGAGVRF